MLLAGSNGCPFQLGDLVDVFVGTGHHIRGPTFCYNIISQKKTSSLPFVVFHFLAVWDCVLGTWSLVFGLWSLVFGLGLLSSVFFLCLNATSRP